MIRPALKLTNKGMDRRTERELEQALSTVGDPSQLLNTDLGLATMNALANDCLTPLIKEELRWAIQAKRLNSGKDELIINEPSPVNEQLTEEDIEKRNEKKKRNCLAARRCREKKRQRIEELEEEVEGLKKKRKEFTDQVTDLASEKKKLEELLHTHCSKYCVHKSLQTKATAKNNDPLSNPCAETAMKSDHPSKQLNTNPTIESETLLSLDFITQSSKDCHDLTRADQPSSLEGSNSLTDTSRSLSLSIDSLSSDYQSQQLDGSTLLTVECYALQLEVGNSLSDECLLPSLNEGECYNLQQEQGESLLGECHSESLEGRNSLSGEDYSLSLDGGDVLPQNYLSETSESLSCDQVFFDDM